MEDVIARRVGRMSYLSRCKLEEKGVKLLLGQVHSLPRDGFENGCSSVFADALFVLKKRMYCSPSFTAFRCQSLVSLSGLSFLQRRIYRFAWLAVESICRRGDSQGPGFQCVSMCVLCCFFCSVVRECLSCNRAVVRCCYMRYYMSIPSLI